MSMGDSLNLEGFNYRLLRHGAGDGCWYGIHEVYYDDEGDPVLCSVDPIGIQTFDSTEPREDIREVLDLILEALDKPVINFQYFDDL